MPDKLSHGVTVEACVTRRSGGQTPQPKTGRPAITGGVLAAHKQSLVLTKHALSRWSGVPAGPTRLQPGLLELVRQNAFSPGQH